MEIDKRVEELEGEFKLIKGEVKQSLSDIRDYVLGGDFVPEVMPLEEVPRHDIRPAAQMASPPPGVAQPLQQAGAYEEIEEVLDEIMSPATEEPSLEAPQLEEEPSFQVPQWEEKPPFETPQLEQQATPEVPPVDEPDTPAMEPESLSHEEVVKAKPHEASDDGLQETGKEDNMIGDARSSLLQANQLPNLIRWVSAAKREIGSAQLPTFLEAYSVRGHLSPAMKEIILHLAVVVAEETTGPSSADVWSRLTLELHGILSDGSS